MCCYLFIGVVVAVVIVNIAASIVTDVTDGSIVDVTAVKCYVVTLYSIDVTDETNAALLTIILFLLLYVYLFNCVRVRACIRAFTYMT